MTEEKYIAAIEVSSSKIIAAVGRSYGAGHLEILAVEQEKAVDAVRYGIVQNLEETSVRAGRLLQRLENAPGVAPRKITGVIAGISGRSLRSITAEVSINLPEDTEITDDIIARLKEDAMRSVVASSLEVVDAVPRTYRVGKTETRTPKGSVGNFIQATYDLIVCRPELKRNLTRTIPDKLGIRIEGFVVTPLATGHLILTPDEKRLGCMLVDMGAETTTVTIYRRGSLRYFATIPLGSRNITRDIQSLNVLEENAEEIKTTSGNAIQRDQPSTLNLNGVKLSDVSNIVVARSEEIVANIVQQIEFAGLKESDLPGGIVVIGGGSRLQGMTDLLAQQSNLPVRRGKLPSYIDIDEFRTSAYDIEEIVSVMYAGASYGAANCMELPHEESTEVEKVPVEEKPTVEEEPTPKKPKGNFFKKFIGSMFAGGGPEDNSDLIE